MKVFPLDILIEPYFLNQTQFIAPYGIWLYTKALNQFDQNFEYGIQRHQIGSDNRSMEPQ